MTRGMDVTFEPLPDLAVLERRWRALEGRAAASFFQGWCWTGSWLRATGARPDLVTVRRQSDEDVALALIGAGREKRLFGSVRCLRLNEAAEPAADRAFVEYNAPLALEGEEAAVAGALATALARRSDWRILRLSGIAPDDRLLAAMPAWRKRLIDRSPAYCVDLAAVRARGGDYLALLSSNTRSQIKRSAKDYPCGAERIERAADSASASLWLAEMRALNAGRHADNAWEEPLFRTFVADLVSAGMADGSVDLLRIVADDALLGYLINFRWRGRAMNYQSAFAPPASAKAKPGLMAHAAAVRHYAALGLDLYSLLAGKDRYKQSLATGEETLEWWSVERFSPVLEAEFLLRRLLGR